MLNNVIDLPAKIWKNTNKQISLINLMQPKASGWKQGEFQCFNSRSSSGWKQGEFQCFNSRSSSGWKQGEFQCFNSRSSGWKQGEFQCFNSRSSIPRCVTFRNVVCIYSSRSSVSLYYTTANLLLSSPWKTEMCHPRPNVATFQHIYAFKCG
jgi:hypothetical protein